MTFLDLTNVKEKTFELLPKGKYQAMITDAKVVDTKAGGKRLNVEFSVMDDAYKGRKIYHNFNIENANAKAVEIGMQELKTLLVCAGFTSFALNSASDLTAKSVGVVVDHESVDGETYARVKYFNKTGGVSGVSSITSGTNSF